MLRTIDQIAEILLILGGLVLLIFAFVVSLIVVGYYLTMDYTELHQRLQLIYEGAISSETNTVIMCGILIFVVMSYLRLTQIKHQLSKRDQLYRSYNPSNN